MAKERASFEIKRSAGEHIFDFVNVIFMLILAFVMLFPFWYVLVNSFSDPIFVSAGEVYWWPKVSEGSDLFIQLESYRTAFAQPFFWRSYANTVFYAVAGTAASMIFTILGAYALSKKRLKGRFIFNLMIVITMWFVAGLVPKYITLTNYGMKDSMWAIVVVFAITPFYVILMRTYFMSISESLEESAKMDGANDWTVLLKIFIPLSVPALMTIGLYYFVARWNSYFWEMILIDSQEKTPLQVVIKQLITKETNAAKDGEINVERDSTTIIYATIIVAAAPMIAVYPFVQKYFVKGIMVGAVKG